MHQAVSSDSAGKEISKNSRNLISHFPDTLRSASHPHFLGQDDFEELKLQNPFCQTSGSQNLPEKFIKTEY